MGWDVAVFCELTFASKAALARWRASIPDHEHDDWPAGLVGRVRRRTVQAVLDEWSAHTESFFELRGRAPDLELAAWMDEERYRARGLELFAALRHAEGFAKGSVGFLGQGIDFAHVVKLASGTSELVPATRKHLAHGTRIRARAEGALFASDPELEEIAALANRHADRVEARFGKLVADLETELARDLASSTDRVETLLSWLVRTGRGASEAKLLAVAQLRESDRKCQGRVLRELEPHLSSKKRPGATALLLLKSLARAEPRAKAVLLEVFRNSRYGWKAQLAAGQALLRSFGKKGDAEKYGDANLPTLKVRIDELFPE
jgi:hypothetical protein